MSDLPANAPARTLKTLLEASREKFAAVAPKYMSSERLIRLILAACSRNPKLMQCTPESVLLFTMRCAETGLEPVGPGGAWPIPYENRKNNTVEMQFIPDYRGLIAVAIRSGAVKNIVAYPVHEKDTFEIEFGLEPKLKHVPYTDGEPGEMRGCYMVATAPDGQKMVQWMRKDEVDAIRGRSRAGNNGPWVTDYEAMALKTVIRRGVKFFLTNPQMSAAVEADTEAETRLTDGIVVDALPSDVPMTAEELAEKRKAFAAKAESHELEGAEKVGNGRKVAELNDGQKLVQMVKMFAIESGDSEANILGSLTAEGDNVLTSLKYVEEHPEHELVKLGLERAMKHQDGLAKKAKKGGAK